jgi:hypothetical protein
MGIAVGRRSGSGVGIGAGLLVGRVVDLHGLLVHFGCLVLRLLACIVMSSGA